MPQVAELRINEVTGKKKDRSDGCVEGAWTRPSPEGIVVVQVLTRSKRKMEQRIHEQLYDHWTGPGEASLWTAWRGRIWSHGDSEDQQPGSVAAVSWQTAALHGGAGQFRGLP